MNWIDPGEIAQILIVAVLIIIGIKAGLVELAGKHRECAAQRDEILMLRKLCHELEEARWSDPYGNPEEWDEDDPFGPFGPTVP